MPVFVIAPIALPEPDAERLALLRRVYDPNAGIVAPHVTMVFALDDGLEDEAVRWVRSCIGTHTVFQMRFTLATVARDYENSAWYLFLLPRRVPPGLAQMHRRLNSGPLKSAPDVAFDGHVSLGRFQERILAEAVARDTNSAGVAIDARIESLEVLLFDGAAVRDRVAFPLAR
jgi:hypothetical protein